MFGVHIGIYDFPWTPSRASLLFYPISPVVLPIGEQRPGMADGSAKLNWAFSPGKSASMRMKNQPQRHSSPQRVQTADVSRLISQTCFGGLATTSRYRSFLLALPLNPKMSAFIFL